MWTLVLFFIKNAGKDGAGNRFVHRRVGTLIVIRSLQKKMQEYGMLGEGAC